MGTWCAGRAGGGDQCGRSGDRSWTGDGNAYAGASCNRGAGFGGGDRFGACRGSSRAVFGGKFELIHADALAGKHALNESLAGAIAAAKSAGKTVRLVANLPYNIASPLVIELLIAGVDLLAFTVQKEVADRLRAVPNTSEYGTLSIVTQLLARVEVLRTLPPQAFWPMPRIESALVRLRREDRLGGRAQDFGRFVQRFFSARRKTMKKALEIAGIDDPSALAAVGIDPKSRPEDVGAQQFLRLFERFGPHPSPPLFEPEPQSRRPEYQGRG